MEITGCGTSASVKSKTRLSSNDCASDGIGNSAAKINMSPHEIFNPILVHFK